MNQLLLLVFYAFSLFGSCASSDKNNVRSAEDMNNSSLINTIETQMRIKIGYSTFTATLLNNETATKFKSFLPLIVTMIELNGNEKYADLPKDLPANAFNPGTIEVGDLMLYGTSTLVLFYKSFSTSYSYTKLGRIDDVKGLAQALGKGNVTVSFESE